MLLGNLEKRAESTTALTPAPGTPRLHEGSGPYLCSSVCVVSLNAFSPHTSAVSCQNTQSSTSEGGGGGGAWAGATCVASWGLCVSRVHMLLFSLFMSIFFAVFA